MRRHTYGRRRTELIDALAVHAPYVHVRGMAAGLQAVLVLPDGVEARTLQAAARQGLAVSGMSEFLHPAAGPDVPRMDALVVNFSSVSDSSWPRALDALCRVLP
jgi:GntR family transcriptional regulator / MocR family aminotransferase